MLRALPAAALAAALSACAASGPRETAAAPAAAPATSSALAPAPAAYTAAPGDVMLVSDPCVAAACAPAAGAPPEPMTELVYVGMRSPTEAVFRRREIALHPGPVKPTAVPGLFVPVRAEVAARDGAFVAEARPPADSVDIVLNPVAGVQLGVEDVVVDITSVTPGRVVYRVRRV